MMTAISFHPVSRIGMVSSMKDISEVEDEITVQKPEPEVVNLLRSPGIDFQPSGPVRQPCLTYWPARLHVLRNRFLGTNS